MPNHVGQVGKPFAALMLRLWLMEALENDTNYEERYGAVLQAMAAAHSAGYQTGYRIDPAEPEWPVAYIELPNGQVSWHMPQHPNAFDGHTTHEKHERIREYCKVSLKLPPQEDPIGPEPVPTAE